MNKPEKNFFYVNRILLNSDRWLSEPFTRGQAWVDLFGLAQHTQGFFRIRGIKIKVKRGQLGYSQLTLAKRWKWSKGKVKRYLKELENDGDIEQQNNNITTLILIKKYDLWQGGSTPDGHQTDTRRYTYNKDNKEKNTRQSTIASDSKKLLDYFFERYFKLSGKKPVMTTWAKYNKNAQRYIKTFGLEEMKNKVEKYFKSTDKFFSDNNYPIDIFLTDNVINKLD